ncbi:MAG: MBL fold metallo-hydrolase [Lachnospiraceae bacterium]|jgi:glyoxylase-like metal-dependent hydrolase (beta-lactamase superfamily II)|nr:MBL fold metallo-hydrolase [Lachnospiraceae bacterium]
MVDFSIETYVVGPVQTNCYFLINNTTNQVIIVDPGSAAKQLAALIREKKYEPVGILLTHGHFDHADAVDDLKEELSEYALFAYAYEGEQRTLEDPRLNLSGDMNFHAKSYHADVYLQDHETIDLAGFHVEVLFTPGHTPGGCCFYCAEEGIVFSGDSLFCQSVGRTDFPEGSMSDLVRGVREQLFVLPDKTYVLPGHNEPTTIGDEKKYNPFLV